MKVFKIGVIGLGDISNVYLTNPKKYSDVVELYASAREGRIVTMTTSFEIPAAMPQK